MSLNLIYRVYYDDKGKVITYATDDLPGKYLVITAEQYAEANHYYIVKNNKLIPPPTNVFVHRFNLIDPGTYENKNEMFYKTTLDDITIIADDDNWSNLTWVYEEREVE